MDIDPSALCTACSSDLAKFFSSRSYLNLSPEEKGTKVAAAFNLQQSLVAKHGPETVTTEQNDRAYAKWTKANEKCATWQPPEKGADEIDELLWGELKEAVRRFFWKTGDDAVIPSLEACAIRGAHGPGASNGVEGSSTYEKSYVGGWTATSEVLWQSYRNAYSQLPEYWRAVDYGTRVGGEFITLNKSQVFFVPKNADISRLAATEPSLNMFMQKGASSLLEDRLVRHFGISLEVQPERNRRLAQLGSIDGSFATIDLSSASDSLSHGLVKSLLPRGVYDVLARLRTPYMAVGQELVKLNMFSTMGNGFTFSLQTVLFACIVDAAYKVSGLRLRKGVSFRQMPSEPTIDQCANFAVFGDDIIVVKRAFPLVKRLLELCGCTLNSKKTFVEGPFRESCGGDYYLGSPIRGVYIKLLGTHNHVYHAVNSLVNWSVEHGIPLRGLVRLLLASIPVRERLYVPPHEQTDAGLHVPLEFFRWPGYNSPCKGDPDLGHRFVYKASIPKVKRVRIRWMDILPGIALIRLEGDKTRGRGLVMNEAGLYQCLLSGHVAKGGWAARQQTPAFRTVRKVTPNWCHRPGASLDWMGRWVTTALDHII